MIEHYLCDSVLFQLDNYTNIMILVGLITDSMDPVDPLILCKVSNVLDKALFVDHVRNFFDDDAGAVLYVLYLCTSSEGNASSSCCIGCTNARTAHDYAACGEIGALYVLHKLIKSAVGVLYKGLNSVDSLGKVVGRYICCHTYRNTYGAVYQKVGETGGKHNRLFESVIIVGHIVDGVLVDIRKHIKSHLVHSCLSITVSSRGVAVQRTEVSVTVNKGISHREILGKSYHGIIYRCVAVGVITTQHCTYGIGALSVLLIGSKSVFIHCVKDTSVNGLKTVSYVGQSTGNYN